MKYKLLLLICFLFTTLFSYSQCTGTAQVTVTGGGCVGNMQTVNSNLPAASIEWKNRAGNTVSLQKAVQSNAVTVAGGNGAGAAANQLNAPDRIFVDKNGAIYVPDLLNNRIQKWLRGATAGITVAGGNGAGSAANQFDRPTSVFVDGQGNMYITDQSNDRVQKWAPGATQGVTIAGGGMTAYLDHPTSVFVNAGGDVYITEQWGGAVQLLRAGSTNLVRVAGTGSSGFSANELDAPTGLFVDDAGNIYICDTENNRVQKWAPGATTGITVIAHNGYGSAANQLYNPLDVRVDCAGNIYVADYNNHRIQKWAPGATAGVTVAGGNGRGSAANQLATPIGLAIDSAGTIYVADYGNNRIQKFTNSIVNTWTPTVPGKYAATVGFACCTVHTDSITILSPSSPDISIAADTMKVCPAGGSVQFKATITNGGAAPAYQWRKNGMNTGGNTATYKDNAIVNNDKIQCVLTSNAGCIASPTAASNSVTITAHQFAPVDLGPDITICAEATKRVDLPATYKSYTWQDGSQKASFTIKDKGKYYVEVQDACNTASSDTIMVAHHAVATGYLRNDTTICAYDKLELSAKGTFMQYSWSTRATTPSVTVSAPGMYKLTTWDNNGCRSIDSVAVTMVRCPPKGIYMPTAFTPNSDGKNDWLKPVFYGAITNYHFSVYNRNGQLVFDSKQLNQAWDGNHKGTKENSTTFVWMCSYQLDGGPLQVAKGTVVLLGRDR